MRAPAPCFSPTPSRQGLQNVSVQAAEGGSLGFSPHSVSAHMHGGGAAVISVVFCSSEVVIVCKFPIVLGCDFPGAVTSDAWILWGFKKICACWHFCVVGFSSTKVI